jgi:hypothetical protein
MRQEEIMSGELLVAGKDSIQLNLKRGKPDTVLVEFKDHHQPIPCNPHHDKVEWELHDRHQRLVLIIKWDVSSPRTVVWAVSLV